MNEDITFVLDESSQDILSPTSCDNFSQLSVLGTSGSSSPAHPSSSSRMGPPLTLKPHSSASGASVSVPLSPSDSNPGPSEPRPSTSNENLSDAPGNLSHAPGGNKKRKRTPSPAVSSLIASASESLQQLREKREPPAVLDISSSMGHTVASSMRDMNNVQRIECQRLISRIIYLGLTNSLSEHYDVFLQ